MPLGGAQRRDIRLLADIQPGLHSDREVRGRQQVSHKPPEHKSQDSFNFHRVGARVSSIVFLFIIIIIIIVLFIVQCCLSSC